MTNKTILDGNEAVASVAYRVTEVNAIYPITPSSNMGEHADQWASEGVKNIWGTVPLVVEMQSEGGAAGVSHGALQTGALATTYTASQGLLLMIPNMYKIAGELTSAVIHVSARSLAAQALSIFGDHSDVMAIRDTGFAMLAGGSVQEAHDMALIAHAATLEARVPFLHFFEGFRVSHEVNIIEMLSDEQLHALIDDDLILAHRKRALTPEHPVIRGTAQNPDVYFQGRETVNPFYAKVPAIVEKYMQKLAEVAGRKYSLMQYTGHPEAERVIVLIGSGAKVVETTVSYLQQKGEKVGVLQIYLYRPFSIQHFINALPATVKSLAVLDRTKEPGSIGEPLYQDVITALTEAATNNTLKFKGGMPKVIAGRYGLSSKEFTPPMAKGIFDELQKPNPKNHFTIGIQDDVSNSSLTYDAHATLETDNVFGAMFFGLGADGTVGANKNTIKIIGEETNNYVQAYFVYDSKKSGSRTVSHLRFGPKPISAPYLIATANFIGCHQFNFLDSVDILEAATPNSTFLLNSPFSAEEVWDHLPATVEKAIIDKKIKFYVIDAYSVAEKTGMGSRINTIMQTCFFAISGILPREEAINKIKDSIVKTYKRKGEEIIKQNFAAVDQTLANLHQVNVPAQVSPKAYQLPPIVSAKAPEFVQKVTSVIMAGKGDDLPVSAMPVDGTYPTATTQWEKRNVSNLVAEWNQEMCIQCGQCALICPHGVIRVKHCEQAKLANAPKTFKCAQFKGKEFPNDQFALQVYVEDCTGCGLCHVVCPAAKKEDRDVKAIMITHKEPRLEAERKNIEFFETLPFNDRREVDMSSVRGVQYCRPLFEFSSACAGCGETPYIKLISQLFGDRMIVANATGCSSIYGGNLPTTPWCVDSQGRGPAWSNSLFEDNAEFGLGFRLTQDKLRDQALEILHQFNERIGGELVAALTQGANADDEAGIFAQRQRISELKVKLQSINEPAAKLLLSIVDSLVKRSVWILGGDGWAYDIGYGGLDHVMASNRNVKALVLDTEVYSNTGGQSSKATPLGAVAKFAAGGKAVPRKDLGLMMMSYGNVYVAQIALGANPTHAIKTIIEAEKYNGAAIVIAYSHCIAHGYNLVRGVDQQKMAVNSGFWPLYRYNPDRIKQNLNPFQLDSREPTVPVRDYAYNEARFKSLLAQNPEHAELLMKELQEDVTRRWKLYSEMAVAQSK
jgi:pyruvate-ferredoxin/flavodoxin oxidoreductase